MSIPNCLTIPSSHPSPGQSLRSFSTSVWYILLVISAYRWGDQAFGTNCDLPKVKALVSGKAGTCPHRLPTPAQWKEQALEKGFYVSIGKAEVAAVGNGQITAEWGLLPRGQAPVTASVLLAETARAQGPGVSRGREVARRRHFPGCAGWREVRRGRQGDHLHKHTPGGEWVTGTVSGAQGWRHRWAPQEAVGADRAGLGERPENRWADGELCLRDKPCGS